VPANDIDPFASDLIRRKARQLIGQAGLRPHDLADVRQELTLRLLRRLPSSKAGDPGHEAMMTAAIRQCVANLLRDRKALKRGGGKVGSLDVPVDDGDGATIALVDAVGKRHRDARLGVRPRTEEDSGRLAVDVRTVLAAESLMTRSVTEVAWELGVPRTTLYEARRLLRMRFERAGLKDYLEQFPSS
jgi:DNA-directed RNA polymerase specialized sigma24 family protein